MFILKVNQDVQSASHVFPILCSVRLLGVSTSFTLFDEGQGNIDHILKHL